MALYMSMGEAYRRLSEHLNEIAEAISSQNGASLKRLLSVASNTYYTEAVVAALNVVKDVSRILKQVDRYGQLSDMLQHHLRCMQSFQSKNYADAYNAQEKFANAFLQEFRNWESAWAVDVLYIVVFEMRKLAEMADREIAANGKNPDKLKGAGSFFMKVFAALAGKGPKRLGALYVACQLFKVYFKLGTVHLCRSVRRSIETARVFEFDEFPVRDKVTYMYYTGRLEVLNNNFLEADEKLIYALAHCDPKKERNIRMILKFLIPVKLSLGILPKEELLQKHSLFQYVDIVQAFRSGDLRLLQRALHTHENEFLRSGVYLVLEKLELQVYQRLVKKIYIIQKQKDPSKAHHVRMETIMKALKWLEVDTDIEEVECMMTILIYRNLMKGYISHKSKVVVLSKQDPFPKLCGRPVNS